jgi:DNA polymerase-3 subunit gamma/tau
LISTIRSRTHHYPFRLVPPAILSSHLERICESEAIKVAKGVIPLVVRASGGSVRDALSILGQLLAGASKDGVTYEIAVALLGYTDGALLDEAIDALAAQDSASLFNAVDRVVESGQDPKRFAQDLLERLRNLIIVGAVDDNNSQVLKELPADQIDRIRTQAKLIGIANLIRAADLVANGLAQMRGATPPRLILELICGQMMLPAGNDAALAARVEKLERSFATGISTSSEPKVAKSVPVADAGNNRSKIESKPVAVSKSEPAKTESKGSDHKPSGQADITSLRRIWPQVIENVKGKRRLTWSLLATSAQIISIDDESINIGIINTGARDSFVRSKSDVILSDAFAEVAGVRRKIVATVDSSVATTTTTRVDEDPADSNMLSRADLLASKLGAKVIKESN